MLKLKKKLKLFKKNMSWQILLKLVLGNINIILVRNKL